MSKQDLQVDLETGNASGQALVDDLEANAVRSKANFDEMYSKLGDGTDLNAVAISLTASTTQTQGQGALTAFRNYVDTVANADDTRTLKSMAVNEMQYVKNRGANRLKIYPASGQDAGAGTNNAIYLNPGEFGVFICEASNTINVERSRSTVSVTNLTSNTTIADWQCYGTHFQHNTATQEIELPASVAGMNFTGEITSAHAVTFDPNGSEIIVLNGTALTGGYSIVSNGTADCMYSVSCRVAGTLLVRAKGFASVGS